jgi:hypothetical protein
MVHPIDANRAFLLSLSSTYIWYLSYDGYSIATLGVVGLWRRVVRSDTSRSAWADIVLLRLFYTGISIYPSVILRHKPGFARGSSFLRSGDGVARFCFCQRIRSLRRYALLHHRPASSASARS